MTPTKDDNFDILNTIMARQIKTSPFAKPDLVLEVISGEYKGIVFSFKTFHTLPVQMEGGFVPVKYETQIHILPPSFPPNWEPTEAFDAYTTEVLFKWLSYINQNDFGPLIAMQTDGVQ
jgi:hypothetical protein